MDDEVRPRAPAPQGDRHGPRVEALVGRLAEALQRRHETAFAECFGRTVTIVGDGYEMVTTERAEFAPGLAGERSFYHFLDVTRVGRRRRTFRRLWRCAGCGSATGSGTVTVGIWRSGTSST